MPVLKKALTTDRMPDLSQVYSWGMTVQGVQEWILISGLGSTNPDWTISYPGDPVGQTRANFERADAILADGGASFRDVVRLDITVTEAARWSDHRDEIRAIFTEYFHDTDPKPTVGTLKIVSGLADPEMLVEIEFLAVR